MARLAGEQGLPTKVGPVSRHKPARGGGNTIDKSNDGVLGAFQLLFIFLDTVRGSLPGLPFHFAPFLSSPLIFTLDKELCLLFPALGLQVGLKLQGKHALKVCEDRVLHTAPKSNMPAATSQGSHAHSFKAYFKRV